MEITDRQKKLLKVIIDEYTISAIPVGSKVINDKYFEDLSSATIRNEMATLEKDGFLIKTHTSSGRVPSTTGYQYYEKNIMKPYIDKNIKMQLTDILSKRNNSIDDVLSQSVSIINELTNLPSVITSVVADDTLKKIDLIQIDDATALVILITSSGNVNKNIIKINSCKQIDDIAICINIFNDRLIDTPISEIKEKVDSIKNIIHSKVKEYEFIIHELVNKIFDINTKAKTNVSGTSKIVDLPEFYDHKKLKKVLTLLESTTIWQQIAYNREKTGKTLITFGEDIGVEDVAVASTTINLKNSKHQVAIVGPTRMNYSQVKGLLDFLKEELEKGF